MPIIPSTLKKIVKSLNFRNHGKDPGKKKSNESVDIVFQFKYSSFKELLNSNAELLSIITSIEDKLQGWDVFGMSFVRRQAVLAVFHALRMVKKFDDLSNCAHPSLIATISDINRQIQEVIESKIDVPAADFTLPLSEVTRSMVDWVGEKSANLGEIANRAGVPIPRGFAITTRAFYAFLQHNGLLDEINSKKAEKDPKSLESVTAVSEEIQGMIRAATLPPELETAIRDAHAAITDLDDTVKVSVRSSALREDGELSFAGQYFTALNVPASRLIEEYKAVVASLYNPRAVFYRLNKGIRDDDIAMSVTCLQMVDAVASGVMYTRHPTDLLKENILLITAVWGLGLLVVDGTISPDTYLVEKGAPPKIIKIEAIDKPIRLAGDTMGGLVQQDVPEDMRHAPCLSSEQIQDLAGYGQKLEAHYGSPQDIEWALDETGKLLILQARPLHISDRGNGREIPEIAGYPLLIKTGAIACTGIGFGPAFHIRKEADLADFPEGGILVAKHSSPKFVSVMAKASAVITDFGSATGHMASLAREFSVPSVLDTKNATEVISPGMEITVDAYSGKVYEGKVAELISLRVAKSPRMKNTPIYQTLRAAADLIVPLNLIDPKSQDFTPQSCKTIHDVMRFVHELSYKYMFDISDHVSKGGRTALKLNCPVNLDLFIIDVGGGITNVRAGASSVNLSDITSAPFLSLMNGLSDPIFRIHQPRPITLDGFFSVMRQQMLTPQLSERFGERSYAIISDNYVNFSSRVGYHYGVVDSYASQAISMNYITFSFKGGAADEIRRNRRVRAIGEILQRYDFSVEVVMDRVTARFQKHDKELTEARLVMIGQLLQFTRQMDMLMDTEAAIQKVATCFCEGDFTMCAMKNSGQLTSDPAAPVSG
ncbi:MAG: PEP/pyruvate-binding domain-containing protein [Pseudomonadota bacterium]